MGFALSCPPRMAIRTALLAGVAALALQNAPAAAQDGVTAVILRGRAASDSGPRPAGPAVLAPGLRVESPAGTWTEIAFSDGGSVVLEPGADFTLRGIERDPATGRLVVRAVAGRGKLRVSTSSDVDIVIVTPGAEIRVTQASAVVEAGQRGLVTLTAGRRITVLRDGGREDVLRRPGFSVAFENGGPRRQDREQLAAAVEPFAPTASRAAGQAQGRRADVDAGSGQALRTVYARERNETTAYPTPILPASSTPTVASTNVPPPPNPSFPTSPQPSRPGSQFSLASSAFSGAGAGSSQIAAPGANSGTSSIDTAGNFSGFSGDDTVNVVTGSFGNGRIRRFAPGNSGAQPARSDAGLIDTAGNAVPTPFNARFQNVTAATDTVAGLAYDFVARIGEVRITTQTFAGFRPTGVGLGATDLFTHSQQSRVTASNANTPRLEFDASASGANFSRRYFGSSLFEIGIDQTTPANGNVFAMSGNNGLMVLVGQSIQAPSTSAQQFDGVYYLTPTTLGTNPASRPATFFVIDKVTEGFAGVSNRPQEGERFFVVGGTTLAAGANGTLPGPGGSVSPGTVTRFAISDGLNPLGGFVTGQTIEAQFRGPGDATQPAAFNRYNAFRPEETFIGGAAKGDTHLLAVAGPDGRNPALRADLQIDAQGRSSASIAVGGIAQLPGSGDLALSGSVVGAARLDTARATVAIGANLGSLGTDVTGAGAHMFGDSTLAPGQIGYFAIGQADTRRGLPGTDAGVQAGRIDNLGGTSSEFAITRLATNVGTPNLGLQPGRLDGLQGFAAGLVEGTPPAPGGSTSVFAMVGAELGDVAIQGRNASVVGGQTAHREFDATVRLAPRAPGEIATDGLAAPPPQGRVARTLSFGADSNGIPTTAVASPTTFAAVIPDAAGRGQVGMASVNADLLAGIAPGPAMPASNEHLAWGYFLGDLVATSPNSAREFAPLGFWVAGRPVESVALQGLTGTASYQGGMIGNVVDANGMRTRIGDFTHQFNFGSRQGQFQANFDGGAFAVGTGLNGSVFSGSGAGTAARTLSVRGAFFDAGVVSSGSLPRATGGVFGIAGSGYGANGIFVGGRP